MDAVAARTTQVTKSFGDTIALDQVTVEVVKGTVYGLIGPNGAGKTTMLSLLSGLTSPTDGSVEVAASSLGVLPDTPLFDRWLTGREVVDLSHSLSARKRPSSRVDEVLEIAGLAGDKNRRVRGYSRGMLQRLGLAATFVSEPEILLLDEPAAALDPLGRREVLDLIGELRGSSTVVFSSHILDDVQAVCDTVGILSSGRLVYEGSLSDLISQTTSTTVYKLEVEGGAPELAQLLGQQEWIVAADATTDTDVTLSSLDRHRLEEELVPWLASTRYTVIGVIPVRRSLEDVFLEVTR